MMRCFSVFNLSFRTASHRSHIDCKTAGSSENSSGQGDNDSNGKGGDRGRKAAEPKQGDPTLSRS